MSDVAVIQPQAAAVIADPLMNALVIMARDPATDMDKLERLIALQAAREARDDERAYWQAMTAAQAEIGPVVRTSKNTATGTMYARLEHVDAIIRPIYTKHGFSLSYDQVMPEVGGNIRIRCKCAHRSGHVETHHREAPPDTMGPKGNATKTALHGAGSTETFLRRYIACGIFNVVLANVDDDGVAGSRETISDEQVAKLRALIAKTPRPEAAFLGHMKVGRIEDIPAHECARAEAAIWTVIAAEKRKAAEEAEAALAVGAKAEGGK